MVKKLSANVGDIRDVDSATGLGRYGVFSCGMWDLVPRPGIELRPPALGVWSLSHRTTREVPSKYLFASTWEEKQLTWTVMPQDLLFSRFWQILEADLFSTRFPSSSAVL